MTLANNVTLGLELNNLALALVQLKLQFVDSCVESLELLCAQERFLFVRQATKSINLLSLYLANILKRLTLAQQNIYILFVRGVLICDASTLFLGLEKLVLNLLYNGVMFLAKRLKLRLMISLHLGADALV